VPIEDYLEPVLREFKSRPESALDRAAVNHESTAERESRFNSSRNPSVSVAEELYYAEAA
jgi:hypothetical protein